MEDVLEQVRIFADQAHADQLRKYTAERYIVHPERVMLICREYTPDLCVLAAALLHDVLEDTPVTRGAILRFLHTVMSPAEAERTVGLVGELTDVYTKSAYPHLNRKSRKELETARLSETSADAQTIKYADLIDNGYDIVKHDRQFGRKYLTEASTLLRAMTRGNPALRERAVSTIDQLRQSF
ncbi:MAG TPA: HD domain-containing protein [Sphingobacteriaceae bacterium]